MSQPLPLVSDQEEFAQLCRHWRQLGVFAFDTEFIRDDTYDAALCLVQVAAGDEVVLIDPTAGLDLAPFWALVHDPEIVTVVHAGKEDFELCLRATGNTPRNVFDVQMAAGFVDFGYPLSLTRLVGGMLNRRLAKGQTLTNWMRRPLTKEQLRYAVEDVAHLPALYQRLSQLLEKTGRRSWAEEEFRRYEDPEYYKPPAEERLFKIKGSRKLDGLGLATLARLIEWRDQWAAERNRPTRALIRDDILVEIAHRRPREASELEVLRGFPQARNPRIVAQVLECIEQARALPPAELPQPQEVREDTPMMKATLDILSACTRAVCHEEGVDKDLVGSAARLRELMDYCGGDGRADIPLLRGWRAEFIGRRLVDLLKGRCELHFSGWPRNPRLEMIVHENERGEGAPRKRSARSPREDRASA